MRWARVAAGTSAVFFAATAVTIAQFRAPAAVTCQVDPAQGEQAIAAAVAACPDGTKGAPTLIQFPAGKTYTQANKILVADRNHIVIDGGGSTFTTSASGLTTQAINGNWVLLRGQDVTLRNMTAVGSFDLPAPRSLERESQSPAYTEAAMGFGIYGTRGAALVDVKALRLWGDGVTTGPAHYVDPGHVGSEDYATDVTVQRMEVRTASRHCWAFTSGRGVRLEDSSCADAWYAGLDSELDGVEQPLRDHAYLRNTFEGFNLGGLLIPVPGQIGKVGGIEIRGNRFLTTPDVECNPTVTVGAYPDIGSGYELADVTVADNEFNTYARAVVLDHVNGGVVRGNRIRQLVPPSGATVLQHCGEDRQIIVTNSTGVVTGTPPPVTAPPTTPPPVATTSPKPTTPPAKCSDQFTSPAGEQLVVCQP